MRLAVLFSLGCALAITYSSIRPARAQDNPATVSGGGEVTSVRDNHAYVRDANGNDLVLDFNEDRIHFGTVVEGVPAPECTVVGEVAPTVVRAGMTVRLSGKVRTRSQLVDPIAYLTITAGEADPNGDYGLTEDTTIEVPENEAQRGVAAFTIHGQVTQVRGTRITITVPNPGGGRPLQIQGTADPQVVVELNSSDFGLVRRGDLVEFEGVPTGGGAAVAGQHIFATGATFTKRALGGE